MDKDIGLDSTIEFSIKDGEFSQRRSIAPLNDRSGRAQSHYGENQTSGRIDHTAFSQFNFYDDINDEQDHYNKDIAQNEN